MQREKNIHVETLRGIAILLVIAGHVIGSDSTGGMKVDDSSIYRYLYCLTENIRLPLFTVISGWVYALNPIKIDSPYRLFLKKKIRRLLFPMIFVGATYYLLQYFTPNTNFKFPLEDIWHILIFPYTLYWYLPALFLLFVIFSFLDRLRLMQKFRTWSIVLLVSLLAYYAELLKFIPEDIPNLFAFRKMLFLSPFFVLGIGLQRFKDDLCNRKYVISYLVLTIIGVALQQFHFFYPQETQWYETFNLRVPIGLVSVALLMNIPFENKWLVSIGAYAYSLYLLHGFGASGGRIIFTKLGITGSFSIFCCAFLLAVILPILCDKLFSKIPLFATLFLGKKFVTKNEPN